VATSPFSPSAGSLKDQAQPQHYDLADLIPRRAQSIEVIQVNNPLASAVVISDKQARQLFALINGKRSVAQLMEKTHMDQLEFTSALRFLLKQKLIQLHDPRGKPVDSPFLEPL
jgi:hypothetical protein